MTFSFLRPGFKCVSVCVCMYICVYIYITPSFKPCKKSYTSSVIARKGSDLLSMNGWKKLNMTPHPNQKI